MKLRDKIFVGFCFLFITVLGISLSFANKTSNNETGRENKYQSWEGSFGEWELASYLTSSSNNISISDDSVTYYRNNDSLSDNEVELHFNTYVKSTDISTIYAGTMLYYVNTSSLFFYDFDYGNFVIDASENRVDFLDSGGNAKGYIKFGSDMPYCDFDNDTFDLSGCAYEADYYWLYNSYGLMIINGKDITNVGSYSVDLSITYALASDFELIQTENEIINGFELLDYADSYFEYDPIIANVTDKIDTIDLSNIHSEEEVEYTSWQTEWGSHSTDYDYYILYPISGNIDYEEYNVSFSIDFFEGTVLAYSSNGLLFYNGNEEDFYNTSVCNVNTFGESDFNCYVVVGYNAPEDKTVGFEMGVNVTTPYETQNLSFNWNHFLVQKGSGYIPEYPSGISNNITQKNNNLVAGDGAINKINNDASVSFSWLMESGSSSITNSYKAFNLWNAIVGDSYTVSISSDKTELDNNYSMVSNPTILNSDDYSIVSFYPQDDVEYDYYLNNDNYSLTPVNDYNSYSQKDVYVAIGTGDYELIGSYVNNGSSIVYVAKDGRTANNNNVSINNPVILPNNVTKIKVSYTGARAAVYMGVNINVELKSSSRVKNTIAGLGDNVVLKNVAGVQVNDNAMEYNRIATYLTSLEVQSYVDSTSVVNDRIDSGKTDLISYHDEFYEQLDYTPETKSEAMNILEEQKNGIVYELLPKGAELHGDVVVKTIGNNYSCSATSETFDSYNGSNRTLLKVTIGNCNNSNYYDTGSSLQSGYVIDFDITYNALANQSFGTTLDKDVMYEGKKALGDGYNSPNVAPDELFSSNGVKNIFASLVNGNNNLLFATTRTVVESMSISVGTYNKSVKNSLDNNYSESANVVESGVYTYKLQYAFTSDLEEITNVVFVDKLENDYGNNKHFNGYIRNYITDIDISNLTSMGVDAKVYYAIGNVNTDIFDITEWSETPPDDPKNLKAVAVVCGSFVFKKSNNAAPTVYINMTAPNASANDLKAYNKSKIFYKRVGESEVKNIESGVTNVSLNKANIEIDGTSNYGKGTQANPAVINGDLSYDISVTNSDNANSFDDVAIEVEVPSEYTILSPSSTGNKVTYTFGHLNANETKNLSINLKLAEPVSGDKVLKATYRIVSLNGQEYSGAEGYIYNKVVLPTIDAHKYVKTSDVNDYSDIANILIKKNEEFTYRIKVVNTSNVIASNVKVVDTVPSGLSVIMSTLGEGTLSGDKITWNVDVAPNSTVNIDYKVKLSSNAVLGTVYRSDAHVSLVNPLLDTNMIYDEDTNIISVLYQIASSVKVTNTLSGALADKNKQFEYTIDFAGTSANAGSYSVYDTKNNSLTALDLDQNGNGSYTFKLKGNETITFKNLTGGINYTVKQKTYDGYDSSVNVSGSSSNGYITTSGNTNEEGTSTFEFTNAYSASGSASISAKVTYDKGLSANMFKLSVDGVEYDVDGDGNIPEIVKNYSNEVGQHTYVIKQINTNLPKMTYDSREFKAVVNITDNKDGTLNTQVKYYDNKNQEVNEVVFNNEYLPNGLKISNVNNSEYIDSEKVFSYEITLTNGTGTYEVKDHKGNKLTDLEFVNDTATYSVNLASNESIMIVDLPEGINYTIKQSLVDYYESSSNEEFVLGENDITVTGTTVEGSKEIQFSNRYDTEATFEPAIKIKLEGKAIEKNEFSFRLLDVSEGSTNGNAIHATNDENGNVVFGAIKYTRPGIYKYEITQLDNGSNHIYFDFSKVLLVLELTDNGDGTMEVKGAYQYENNEEYLVNKYSVEPIKKEEEQQQETKKNPNTKDRITTIIVLLITVIVLLFIEKWVRYRRFTMDA